MEAIACGEEGCLLISLKKKMKLKIEFKMKSTMHHSVCSFSDQPSLNSLPIPHFQSAEVIEFVKKDFDELSTTVKTEATNVVQQTTTVFKETLQVSYEYGSGT